MFEVKREHCVTVLERLLYTLCVNQAETLEAINKLNRTLAAQAEVKKIDAATKPKPKTTTARKKGAANGKNMG